MSLIIRCDTSWARNGAQRFAVVDEGGKDYFVAATVEECESYIERVAERNGK